MDQKTVGDVARSVVSFILGFFAVKFGLDEATVAGLAAAVGALVVAVWPLIFPKPPAVVVVTTPTVPPAPPPA